MLLCWMGMAYHLLQSNKYDKDFLDNYTEGFDKFKDYLYGKEDKVVKDVKWASKICGIDEKTIKELANLMYENRTMIMAGWGIQRAQYGEQPHWMLVTFCFYFRTNWTSWWWFWILLSLCKWWCSYN